MCFLQLEPFQLLLFQVVVIHGVPNLLLLPYLVFIIHYELAHVHVNVRQRLPLFLFILTCTMEMSGSVSGLWRHAALLSLLATTFDTKNDSNKALLHIMDAALQCCMLKA